VTVDNIFSVESNALPSYDEIKNLPNKVLLWCGKKLMIILVSFQNVFSCRLWGIIIPSCTPISLQVHVAQIY
jgi:poly [ADP-ribose] polymerase